MVTKINKEQVSVVALAFVFVCLFIPYIVGLTRYHQLFAIGTLWCYAFLFLPLVFNKRILLVFRGLQSAKYVLFAIILPVAPTLIALSSHELDAVGYAILMSVVLTACQVVLSLISIRNIFRAFSYSAVVSMGLFVLSDFSGIAHSVSAATRLIPPATQPNALGFIFAGFVAVCAWRTMDVQTRYTARSVYCIASLAGIFIIFLASSRGSMLALVSSVLWGGCIWCLSMLRGQVGISRNAFVSTIVLTCIGLLTLVLHTSVLHHGMDYMGRFLQLESHYRGINSGLSGRLTRWDATLGAIFGRGIWVFGAGYRTSTTQMGFSVDNGYLVVAYEMGLGGLIIIVIQLLWCLWISARYSARSVYLVDKEYFILMGSLLIIFMVNNIFDRYLFGLGNPFSVLGLFLLLARRCDVICVSNNVSRVAYVRYRKWRGLSAS